MFGSFKNVRDKYEFVFLARQIYPKSSNSLYKAYLDAHQRPHGYLILYLSQEMDDRLRFEQVYSRQNILLLATVR